MSSAHLSPRLQSTEGHDGLCLLTGAFEMGNPFVWLAIDTIEIQDGVNLEGATHQDSRLSGSGDGLFCLVGQF